MHWCMDETLALLSLIPFIGYFFSKLHVWYHNKFHHKCHEKLCHEEHMDHYDAFARDARVGHLSKEDADYLKGAPATLTIMVPVIIDDDFNPLAQGWDRISIDDVVERFGGTLVSALTTNRELLNITGIWLPTEKEYIWYVNQDGDLIAMYQLRIFIHDELCTSKKPWQEVKDNRCQ